MFFNLQHSKFNMSFRNQKNTGYDTTTGIHFQSGKTLKAISDLEDLVID